MIGASVVLLILALLGLLHCSSSVRKARAARKLLKNIPTIGASGALSSYIEAYRLLFSGYDAIQEGYNKYRGAAFKIPQLSRWMVVVSGAQMVEDIRKATDDQLSFRDAVADVFQIDHTIGREIHYDPYHVPVIRNTLTRRLVERFPDIQEEIVAAFEDHIPMTEAWTNVVALPTAMQIVCRTSNRLFVGLPLCRDSDYRALNINLTVNVVKAARMINRFPAFLKPLAGRIFSDVPQTIEHAMRCLAPVIQERLDQVEQDTTDWMNKPDDYLSWLLEVASGKQRTVRDLTIRVLAINFAAIHTTSSAFTQALFHLASYPSYVAALREEVEGVVDVEGLTRVSLHKLRKLDSFIKESQRFAGMGAIIMQRKVLKDFTFSDGTVVPEGNTIVVANYPMHHDQDIYSEPDRFDGFRFARLRDNDEGVHKHQMVSLGHDYIVFGHGRHACPGRFFAVNELKALLAHVILHYDVGLENGDTPPAHLRYGFSNLPDPTAAIMFRKRRISKDTQEAKMF